MVVTSPVQSLGKPLARGNGHLQPGERGNCPTPAQGQGQVAQYLCHQRLGLSHQPSLSPRRAVCHCPGVFLRGLCEVTTGLPREGSRMCQMVPEGSTKASPNLAGTLVPLRYVFREWRREKTRRTVRWVLPLLLLQPHLWDVSVSC